MASIRKRANGKWQIRWVQPDGATGSWTVNRKRVAEQLKREIEDTVDAGRCWEPREARPLPHLGGMSEEYLQAQAATTAPNTVRRKTQMVGMFLAWLQATERSLTPDVLTRALLEEYHVSLLDPQTGRHLHGRSAETARKHLAELAVWWSWLFENSDRWDCDIPFPRKLRIPRKPPAEQPAPTWEEMDRCIAHARGWVQRVAVVLRFTGLRVDSQVMQLQWDDIDFVTGTLRVRPELGKTASEQRGRWVPVSEHLLQILAGWGRREGYLIDTPRGVREVRARDMGRAWKRAGVREEVWGSRANHAFRAGFKSGLRRAGVDQDARDYLVGHSRGIDAHYIDPASLGLVEAVSKIPPLCNVNGPLVAQKPVSRSGQVG